MDIFLVAGILTAGVCSGCKKFLQLDPDKNKLRVDSVFSNDSTVADAMQGLYYKIMNTQTLLNGSLSIYAGLSADELMRTSPKLDEDQFYTNELLPENNAITTYLWKSGYYSIYFSNTLIVNLNKSPGISKATKNRFTGEAKLIRGLCYWYLVNLFGGVPCTTSPNINDNILLPRASESTVFKQVENDFLSAMSLLTDTVANTRPSKLAAAALLARTYCYWQEWEKAEQYATIVISNGRYNLADLSQVFSLESPETLFQLLPASKNNSTIEGNSFVPAIGSPANYILTNKLRRAFEGGDRRRRAWTRPTVSNGLFGFYPFKFKINNATSVTEGNVILRLAEQYLIRAEARVRQGDVAGAASDINAIRERAGLAPVSSNFTTSQYLDIIEKERQVEFFAEMGHRWFDLKRTATIDAVLGSIKGRTWNETDKLYPIPGLEVQRNPSLIQNDGY